MTKFSAPCRDVRRLYMEAAMGRRYFDKAVIKEVTILGQKVKISVDSDGTFTGSVNGDYLKSDTLAGLLPKLRRSAQKSRVKIAIPATLIGVRQYEGLGLARKYKGMGCQNVILTGRDPRTDKIQFKAEDGTAEEIDRWSRHDTEICQRMPLDEQKRWATLYRQKQDATDALYEFEKRWKFDADQAIKDALSAAVDDPKETEELPEDPR